MIREEEVSTKVDLLNEAFEHGVALFKGHEHIKVNALVKVSYLKDQLGLELLDIIQAREDTLK